MITLDIRRNVLRRRRYAAIVAVVLALGSGCTSVTFKRGASPTTMAADETACREDNAAEDAYRRCMRDNGWFVAGGASSAASSATSQSGRAGTGSSPASKVIDFSLPSAEPDVRAVRLPTTRPPLPTTPSVASNTTPRLSSSIDASSPKSPPVGASTGGVALVDGSSLVSVASWWKFGGTAGGLDTDIDDCTRELGDNHRPVPAATRVSRAMGDCLRKRGWYAIGK